MNHHTDISASCQTAVSLYSAGQLADALATLDPLLQAHPAQADALLLAALSLEGLHREEDAKAGRPAPAGSIDVAEAHNHLGVWLHGRGRYEPARHAYLAALSIRPAYAKAMNNLGLLMRALEHDDEAEALFRQALAHEPRYVSARNNLGVLLWETNRLAQAETAWREALAIEPTHVESWNNLGLLLKELNRLPESEDACRHALALRPDLPEAHNNLGNVLWSLGQLDAAIDSYRQSLALRPDYAGARANLALPLLALGRFAEAWPHYEARHDERIGRRGVNRPPLPWPRWQGEPLTGRSVLVWPEQGLGDSLQFCRYLPMLKARGAARVSFACPPPLVRLFERIEGLDACIPLDGHSEIPPHDTWCLLMSLPMHFATTLDTIPAAIPYLHAPAALIDRWRTRLPDGAFKVGLVWAGDPRPDQSDSHAVDQRRSLHASAFLPLLQVPGVTFVSLQKGATTRPQTAALPPSLRPFDPMGEVRDFADTAAIVDALDLVIAVDTSVAHLAGGLGKPVWILSRFDGCWRWLRDRDDTPWYPAARLFRQSRPGHWDDVIARVAIALREAAASHGATLVPPAATRRR